MSTTSVQERLAIKTPEFPHKEPSPLKRAVHTACAPRLCGWAPLSMHPIARRSRAKNAPR